MINHQPRRMINNQPRPEAAKPPRLPRMIHKYAPLVILAWLGIIFLLSVAVPPLDQVAEATPGFAEPQRCTLGAGDGDHRKAIQGI